MTDKQLGTFLHGYADKLQMKLAESNQQLMPHLGQEHFKEITIGNRTMQKCKYLFPVNSVITQMRRDANSLIGIQADDDNSEATK